MGNEDVVFKIKCCNSEDSADIERGSLESTENAENKEKGTSSDIDSLNNTLDFVELLPMELTEEIFSYLGPKDLAAATKVSFYWREAVNSNKLWGRLCNIKGWKHNFDQDFSHFHNTHRLFQNWEQSYDTPFNTICEKRLLFNKYSCLLKNWKFGKFINHKIVCQSPGKNAVQLFEPVTCDGKYLVMAETSRGKSDVSLAVWSLDGFPFRMCDLSVPYSMKPVEAVTICDGIIVFVQDWSLVVYKLDGCTFKFAFSLDQIKVLEPEINLSSSLRRLIPFLKITKEYIICVPSQSYSTVDYIPIFFWDKESGEIKKKLQFDSMYYQILNSLWLGESCYLALTNKKTRTYHILEFGTKSANWEYFSQTVPGVIQQITGNDQYILAVTKVQYTGELDLFVRNESNLYLWDRATGALLKNFKVNGKGFQFVGNSLIFFDSTILTVLDPLDPAIRSVFDVCSTISSIKACVHAKGLVLIKTGCYIEVWDWGLGIRLYSIMIETGYGSQVWCDELRIITYQSPDRRDNYGIMVIGFW